MLWSAARIARAGSELNNAYLYEAAILCRSLFEHVVKFCWVAIDPVANLPRFGEADLIERRKAVNDAKTMGLQELAAIQIPPRSPEPSLPSIAELCSEVDAFWGPRVLDFGSDRQYLLRGRYISCYRFFSAMTHGQGLGLQSLLEPDEDGGLTFSLIPTQLVHAVTLVPVVLAPAMLVGCQLGLGVQAADVFEVFESAAEWT